MKKIILLVLLAYSHVLAAGLTEAIHTTINSARYSHTTMTDNAVIQQFFKGADGTLFVVTYRDGNGTNSIEVETRDGLRIDVRSDNASLEALKNALIVYLRRSDRNDRAASDVMAALCLLSDERLKVYDMLWLGSRG